MALYRNNRNRSTKKENGVLFYLVIVLLLALLCLLIYNLCKSDTEKTEPTSGAALGAQGEEDSLAQTVLGSLLAPGQTNAAEASGEKDKESLNLLPEDAVNTSADVIYNTEAEDEQGGEDQEMPQEIKIEIEKINHDENKPIKVKDSSPNILIYHTHTTEAYYPTKDSQYKENGEWRTKENDKNIVAVGDLLAQELEERGFHVIHDTTDHEPPKLGTAYTRSVKTMEKYRDQYEDLEIYIDVHRDASSKEAGENDYVTIDGKQCAKVMFVVGTGREGYSEMPDWKSNYAFAKAMTEELASYNEDLVRPIRVKDGRYNQHISDKCLLIEIGHNYNTLEQAKNTVEYIAKAMDAVVQRS